MRRHSRFKPLHFSGHGNPFRAALQQRQNQLNSLALPVPSDDALRNSASEVSVSSSTAATVEDICSTSLQAAALNNCLVTMSQLRSQCPGHCAPEAEAANISKRKFQLVDKHARSKLKAIVPEPAPMPTPEPQTPEKSFQELLTHQVLTLCQATSRCLPSANDTAALILEVPLVLDGEPVVPVVRGLLVACDSYSSP
jgi:hypothetical protein